jgi:hypothetical protein
MPTACNSTCRAGSAGVIESSRHRCGITSLTFILLDTDMVFGEQHLATLHQSWADTLRCLTFSQMELTPGFFPALNKYLPWLQSLQLPGSILSGDDEAVGYRMALFATCCRRQLEFGVYGYTTHSGYMSE